MPPDSSTPQDVGFRVSRRGFLGAILAAAAAPAIVRADSLMRIVPMDTTVIVPGAAEMLAELEAADALAAGLQLREWAMHDIVTDRVLTRYDVIALPANGGEFIQLGVDFDRGDPTENRKIARDILAANLRQERATPLRDKLELPMGARFV